ncbi:MAG TPA: fatty acid desaturase [Thermoanaerobaculia bacterium]|nr:fatty acid desaturase [Thermoanaerobaculia bacterium]
MAARAPSEEPRPEAAHYWARHSAELRARLAREIPHDELKRLHRKRPWRHFAIAIRQTILLAAATYVSARFANPLVWIPSAIVAGFTLFNFTVLLHDVIHNDVWTGKHDRANRILGLLYAFPSGISASQFSRWHLTHHAELGSETADPKRHRLSPKINARWLKILYFTPALFVIYFRAAKEETRTYPAELQRTIRRERNATILLHLAIAASVWVFAGFAVAARVYLVPYFLVFPVAFALNRLGQHYDIDRDDPAKWGTLMKSSWFWNFAYVNSNFHLEHHYFPSVPLYNLPRLNRLLMPFFRSIHHVERNYPGLVCEYLVLNKKPHTDWDLA